MSQRVCRLSLDRPLMEKLWGFPWWSSGEDCASKAGSLVLIPDWGTKISHAS